MLTIQDLIKYGSREIRDASKATNRHRRAVAFRRQQHFERLFGRISDEVEVGYRMYFQRRASRLRRWSA
jgi:hypothetical protein